ncbi:TIGR02266 family protein [Sorangium sp. So ce136]|uniref:TIGR02266 family protein n=1 Tax=Sorangium sp. So ce136 TaxID=3133284 RepID=UPI003EFE4878
MTGGRGDSNHPPSAPGGSPASCAQASAYVEASHAGDEVERESPAPDSLNRRSSERLDVTWLVDCETDDTFLYASITNISEMGIFVRTTQPLSIGTRLTLRFAPPGTGGSYVLEGTVQWINEVRPLHDNPNPGMGIRFVDLTPDDRERIVDTIRTIAYIRDAPVSSN